jgi:uncharacterized damage-inducible protein DinB
MSDKETLSRQFTKCYDENGWFVATKNAIANVTAEQAEWKPEGADNSIRELIQHLNYYTYAYLERFKGNDYEYKVADNDETFDKGETDSWEAEAARFNAIMTEWREVLEKADEAKFEEIAPPHEHRKWRDLLADMNAHTAHHGGQIVLLRKLQGSWESGKGVS